MPFQEITMANKKHPKVAGKAALIVEARAGVSFTSDYVGAELFAATSSIARALKAYVKSARPGTDDRAITDILVDLRHYCDSKGLVFEDLNAVAEQHYWDEKADLASL
jgi:hypothetical protein